MQIIIFVFLFLSSTLFATVPTFSLRDLDGQMVNINQYLGKKIIVLDFWATWCKPCVKNLPKLEKVYQEFKDQGVVVLGLNQDGPRSLNKVEPFALSLGLTFPILLDEDQEVVRKYQVAGFPTTIVIDRDQSIALTLRGYRPGDEEELKRKIQLLLQEQK